jgi:hypothetical protein
MSSFISYLWQNFSWKVRSAGSGSNYSDLNNSRRLRFRELVCMNEMLVLVTCRTTTKAPLPRRLWAALQRRDQNFHDYTQNSWLRWSRNGHGLKKYALTFRLKDGISSLSLIYSSFHEKLKIKNENWKLLLKKLGASCHIARVAFLNLYATWFKKKIERPSLTQWEKSLLKISFLKASLLNVWIILKEKL